ncbi:T9SS C-terminal target domain-containing protein [candidate division KSB1 bacterium]|nr:T9SS type A sorting domain-containing protein [candidate division KSB1 bacterium]RQW03138.1 MAG: T9SS C-terminal target domain-containing protein [candidate division KSB1 bacterium]
MKKYFFIFMLITVEILWLSSTGRAAFDRDLEPIIINGSATATFLGKPIAGIRAYVYSSASGTWTPIPFQVDEFTWPDYPAGAKKVVWDGDGILTAYDEIVLMGRDAGDKAPDNSSWPDNVESRRNLRYEVAITDPATLESGYSYIFFSNSLSTNAGSYVSYYNEHVKSAVYGIGHNTDDASGLPDSLAIAGNNIDFLDSWRIRALIRKIVIEADLGAGKVPFTGTDIYFAEDMHSSFKLKYGFITITVNANAYHEIDSLKVRAGQVRILREHTLAIKISTTGIEETSRIPILTRYYRDMVQFKPAFSLDLGDDVKEIDADYVSFAQGFNSNAFGMRFFGDDFTLEDGTQDSLIDRAPPDVVFLRDINQEDWPGKYWVGYSGLAFSKIKNASLLQITDLNGEMINPGIPKFFYQDLNREPYDPLDIYGLSGMRIYSWSKPPATSFDIDATVRYYYFTKNQTRSELRQLFKKYKNAGSLLVYEQKYLDTIPPGPITDLAVKARTDSTITIEWTARGDDGDGGGPADYYIIRYSTVEPNDPAGGYDWTWWSYTAQTIPNPPAPAEPFTKQSLVVTGLTEATTFHFRMNVVDHAGQPSGLSNVASGWTTPVELVSFVGSVNDQNGILLQWSTASETNNLGFAVERQRSGDTIWKEVGFVHGAGTTSEEQRYTFIDAPGQPGEWTYRLKQVDTDGSSVYSDPVLVTIAAPREFVLQQNYPNPFNPETTISFQVPETATGEMILVIYDMLGRQVRTLMKKQAQPGYYSIKWDGYDDAGTLASSGVYIYRLRVGTFTATKKMVKLQ